MPSSRSVSASAGGRRRLRSFAILAAVASGTVVGTVVPAAADEPGATTVVGELMHAWEESAPSDAADHEHGGLMSWVQPPVGEPVLVDPAGVSGVPAGSTVAVTVGGDGGLDEDGNEHGTETPLEVLGTELVAAPETPAAPAPAAGPVTNQVTVAMVAPAGSPAEGDGTPLGRVVSTVGGAVADFWAEQSNGTITLGVTDTRDWLATAADCSQPAVLWDEVAAAVGFVPGPGKHLLLYVSQASDCAYAMAEVGSGPSTGGRLYVRDTTASVISHELGHNFGLGHSSAQQCAATVEGGSCRTVAYRDLYDVMGMSWSQMGSLNAAQAALLGVLPAAQYLSLSVQADAVTVDLTPLSGRSGTRAVRLVDAEGVGYWLEYRTATGRDSWLAGPGNAYGLEPGVLLRRAGGLPDTSVLLDGTPAAAPGWDRDLQSALPVGVPVPVSGADFSVVVQSVSAGGAVVSITSSRPAGPAAPAAVAPRAPSGTVMQGSPAQPDEPGAAAVAPLELSAADLTIPARPSTAALRSAADSADGNGFVFAGAGAVLGGATLLLVRWLRTAVVRSRRAG